MAYNSNVKGVPSEMASKIGHLSVIEDEFVKSLLKSFETSDGAKEDFENLDIKEIDLQKSAEIVICVDGSFTIVPHTLKDHKKLAYIKIAAIGLNIQELEKANKVVVNPEDVSRLISDYSTTQSTVLPLENILIPGQTLKDSLRKSIYLTFENFFSGKLLETLVFLVGRSWAKDFKLDAHFQCPYCGCENVLPRGKIQFECKNNSKCNSGLLTIVDYLGMLNESADDASGTTVATDLMLLLEHLTLIYYLRELVEGNEDLSKYLLLKDGPLLLSGQYSRLVDPIREYMEYLRSIKKNVNLVGIEKSGTFVNHVPVIKSAVEFKKTKTDIGKDFFFIPENEYIFSKIKYSLSNTLYGERVLYGSKVFYSSSEGNTFVLTIPIGDFKINPEEKDFIGFNCVLSTIKRLQSNRYEGGLIPIIAVNSIASMSYYPSNNILGRFTDNYIRKK